MILEVLNGRLWRSRWRHRCRRGSWQWCAATTGLIAEVDNLWAEGAKLRAEGAKLWAEGDKLWAEGVIQFCGNITIEWTSTGCKLGNGLEFKHE